MTITAYGKVEEKWPRWSRIILLLRGLLFFHTLQKRSLQETGIKVFEASSPFLNSAINQKPISKLLRISILFFLNSLDDTYIVQFG